MIDKLKKVALWMMLAVLAAAAVYVWHPWPYGSSAGNTLETPKGDVILRVDKEGNLTSARTSAEAQRNHVSLVVTFKNGVKKYCGGSCSTDLPVTKLEAKVGDKIIATWP